MRSVSARLSHHPRPSPFIGGYSLLIPSVRAVGAGQGEGGEVGDLPNADADFEPSKIKGAHGKAKPLGLFFTRGAGKKGKGKVQASAVVRELRQAAEDALAKERIPAGHKRYIRQYFDTIEPDKARGQ